LVEIMDGLAALTSSRLGMQAPTTTTSTTTNVAHLNGYSGWIVLAATGAVVLLAGVIVLWGRWALKESQSDSGGSFVRSWIAVSLVAGLLLFCAVALAIGDGTVRSTLFGGLITSTGAAVAFYFSSKTAEQARQDVMHATSSTSSVPDLLRQGNPAGPMTLQEAQAAVAHTPLQLVVRTAGAQPAQHVTSQTPDPGTNVRNGSTLSIDTA
jgi:hypothetical protein